MALRFETNGEKQRTPAGRKRAKNLSFYAALVLCAGAIVLTALTRPDDTASQPEPLSEISSGYDSDSFFDASVPSEEALSDSWSTIDLTLSSSDTAVAPATVPTTATTTAPQRAPGTEPSATTSAAVPASAPLRFRMPADGGITSRFSGDELIFCATMCDWRVHNGVDIAGQAGGEVLACADGIVENFVEDMLYGNTAIIRHADDSVMYYCGLSDTQMVSAGLQVHAGDVIGYIGEVPCEMADGPHIHLSLMKDGQFIDPASVLPAA